MPGDRVKPAPCKYRPLARMARTSCSQGCDLAMHVRTAIRALERLGHSTISITLDTYAHVLSEMQRELAMGIDRGPQRGEEGDGGAGACGIHVNQS